MALEKQLVWQTVLAVLGVIAWLATQTIALGLAAGGDGWNAPDLFSVPLLLLYPAAFVRAFSEKKALKVDVGILLIAVALDLFFVTRGIPDELEYFSRAWKFASDIVVTWAALWTGWQLLALIALFRKRPGLIQPKVA